MYVRRKVQNNQTGVWQTLQIPSSMDSDAGAAALFRDGLNRSMPDYHLFLNTGTVRES